MGTPLISIGLVYVISVKDLFLSMLFAALKRKRNHYTLPDAG